ncbi:MAG: cobyric acid synthase [Burkholderiales bacterium]
MTAHAIMVLGTTSHAGKSWLTTALCRWYARQGLKVAPFKAQNMSNNARVVAGLQGGWGEIGSAQYFQALAARARPEVRMNPVLLKPENDTASQVVVLGEVRRDLAAVPWRQRSEQLWPHAQQALMELMQENDLVLIEGAGSPAEINLHASDYVNMRTALAAQAACLLVTDIDRGGAFAHLFGTHQLLPKEQAALIRGFVLNRFRGDARLLAPGPEQLRELTGVPTVAVLPMWREHGLPEEDGVMDERSSALTQSGVVNVAVIAAPRISNLDEFQTLRHLPGVRLTWARKPGDLHGADWVVLPGSKHTSSDLAWLRSQQLDIAIQQHAARCGPVLGICGGLQMLGQSLHDPHGVDGSATGLGLLPLRTTFAADKRLCPTTAAFSSLHAPWSALAGLHWEGYEIRHGLTEWVGEANASAAVLRNPEGQAIGWQQGSVLGIYAHGLFESSTALQALFGASVPHLEAVFDGLADFVDQHFEAGVLQSLLLPSKR